MKIIAIEGLCFSGKSSLAKGLQNHFGVSNCIVVDDYSSFLLKKQRPSVPAKSLAEEIDSFNRYLEIDKLRWRISKNKAIDSSMFILDRCYHSLLAHVYANSLITNNDWFSTISDLFYSKESICHPDILLFLDTNIDILLSRYKNVSNGLPPLFKSGNYMRYFREYFLNYPANDIQDVFIIDSNNRVDDIRINVIKVLRGNWIC